MKQVYRRRYEKPPRHLNKRLNPVQAQNHVIMLSALQLPRSLYPKATQLLAACLLYFLPKNSYPYRYLEFGRERHCTAHMSSLI